MNTPLRCDAKLHGILVGDGLIEVKCQSRFCGAKRGVVVLHRFSMSDGNIVTTLRFREPENPREEGEHARDSTSVRSA